MNRSDLNRLLAERGTLQRLLKSIPETKLIQRNTALVRLSQIDAQIASAQGEVFTPAKATITFRGRPVNGTRGIIADFGANATKAYVDAVSLVKAGMSRPLAATGPIPNAGLGQLLITGTALGSFGFVIEEQSNGQLFEGESLVGRALNQVQDILQGTLSSDDELAEAVTGADERAIASIREFLKIVANGNATFNIDVGGKAVNFRSATQINAGAERLSQDNLREKEEPLTGEFLGALPNIRRFEFKLADSGEIISGKIGPGVDNPNLINDHRHEKVQIRPVVTRVGQGRPKYFLNALPPWDIHSPGQTISR